MGVTVYRTSGTFPSASRRCGRWFRGARGVGGRTSDGGVHRAPGKQVHRLHTEAAPLLGRDRVGTAVGPANGRTSGGSASVLVPGSRRAEGREVAPGRRDVAAARSAGVEL